MREDGRYQIGYVTGRVGLSLRTVRYYDEVGLVEPSGRTGGGFRLYTEPDIARLELVKQLKPLDFSLDELRDLLQLRDRLADGSLDPARRAELAARLDAYVEIAEQRCEQLRDQLDAVETVTTQLRGDLRDGRRHPAPMAER